MEDILIERSNRPDYNTADGLNGCESNLVAAEILHTYKIKEN